MKKIPLRSQPLSSTAASSDLPPPPATALSGPYPTVYLATTPAYSSVVAPRRPHLRCCPPKLQRQAREEDEQKLYGPLAALRCVAVIAKCRGLKLFIHVMHPNMHSSSKRVI